MKLKESQSVYLDALRGLSAVAVLVGHTLSWLPDPGDWNSVCNPELCCCSFLHSSGFLISYSAAKRAEYNFGSYLLDRFFRVYTAYIPALVFIAIVDQIVMTSDAVRHTLQTFMANTVMLQSIPFERINGALPYYQPFGSGSVLWTISVEWWLYVAFGLVFFAGSLRGGHLLLAAILAGPTILTVVYFTTYEILALVWIASAVIAVAVAKLNIEKAKIFAPAMFRLSSVMLSYRFFFFGPRINF